jgi:hypothetical protein
MYSKLPVHVRTLKNKETKLALGAALLAVMPKRLDHTKQGHARVCDAFQEA